jgi:hypothetical protein
LLHDEATAFSFLGIKNVGVLPFALLKKWNDFGFLERPEQLSLQ